ncbi:MAG: lytic transglycosylase domain-containing protein [Stagnimonas sp.]|nr:lytic transglycosylase domain-containing protein [Stagnimonas sp.]
MNIRCLFLLLLLLLLPALVFAGPVGTPEPELRARLAEAITAGGSFDDKYEAQVWLLDYSPRLERYLPDERQRLDFLRQVHAEAKRARLDPELVLSVIHIESRFDRHAISYAGALGYMQIMPFWLTELGQKGSNLFKTEVNLRMGCTILRFYLDKEKGDVTRALARYNGSLGRMEYPDLVLGVLRSRYFAF